MSYGYTGKVLRINLTSGSIGVEEPEEKFYRRYFGGVGFVGYYLLNELEPGVDPLGTDNKLIFALGVVSGAPLPGSGRNAVGAKSPMTDAFGKSEVGGFWGAELKRAGYDAIIVEGKAEKPVYLWIHDGEADTRDAGHLWGKSTKESQQAIRAELGDRLIRTAQIGPGGERQVRFACIINDLKDAAGRTGMGAVMGSKNLKAIAVRGHTAPQMANPDQVSHWAKWMARNYMQLARGFHDLGTGAGMAGGNLTGNLPVRNFRDGYFEEVDAISAEAVRNTIRIGMEGCFACPIRCKKVVEVKEPYNVDPFYGGPEYETLASFGSNCGVGDLKAIAKGHDLCHAYSLDTISTGGTVAFAMECFENGLLSLKDTDGIELTFGNAAAMVQIIEKIGKREGIGDLLAEGSLRAARHIGGGAEQFAIQVKGVEMGMHEPRLKQGLGLGYSVAAHGADHGVGLHDTMFAQEGASLQRARALGILDPIPLDDLSPRKAALLRQMHCWSIFRDCLVTCSFVPYDYQQTMDIVRAVAGWNSSLVEGMVVGERAVTMARAFNTREGLTTEDDRLPQRFFSPPRAGALKEVAIDPTKMEQAKHFYYKLMGWEASSGLPTFEKLQELGIGWVADKLAQASIRR